MPTKTRINGENYTQLPRLVSDDIILKGLPNTPSAPAGYGDLASAVNAVYAASDVDVPKTVSPLDFYDVIMLSSSGSIAYGVRTSASSQVVQIDDATGSVSNYGSPLPINGIRNIKPINSSTMLVEADGGTAIYKLYRTTDSGASWSLVYTAPFSNLRMLTDRSVCVAELSGMTVIFFGEYNINGSRVAGSTNDAVRLLRSDDLGTTWSEVTRWNTDGTTRNIRHIHCVKQSPDGYIYVATGDADQESSIYRWDGVTPWPVNVTPVNLVQSGGLKNVQGRQRWRAVDILFKDEYMWWMPDTNSGSSGDGTEIGIWRMNSNLDESTSLRITTCNSPAVGHAGWLGVWVGNRQVWVTGADAVTSGYAYSGIITSNESLTEYEMVGAFRTKIVAGGVTPYSLSEINSNIYYSASNPSGKGLDATSVFVISENDYIGNFSTRKLLETVHPVYWVSSSGSNSNDGLKPASPFLTIDYAVSGDRMTHGGRLQLLTSIDHNGGDITPKFNANAQPGDSVEPAQIQGFGATKTKVTGLATMSAAQMVNMIADNSIKLEIKDLTWRCLKNVRVFDAIRANNALYFSRAIVGEPLVANTALTRTGDCPIIAVSSVFTPFKNGFTFTSASTTPLKITMENCVQLTGAYIFYQNTTAVTNSIDAINCKFYGIATSLLEIVAGTIPAKRFLNCDISSTLTPTLVIDGAANSWSNNFLSCKTSNTRGVAAAFDAYCTTKPVSYEFNLADYVY